MENNFMRKEIELLNDAFDDFIASSGNNTYEFGEKEVKEYQKLMVELFSVLKDEWKENNVKKDIALLMATVGSFVGRMDDDGNVLGNQDYDRVTTFHMLFITNMFRYDYFRFDDDGKLLIDSYESVLHIDTKSFKVPSLDKLYNLG